MPCALLVQCSYIDRHRESDYVAVLSTKQLELAHSVIFCGRRVMGNNLCRERIARADNSKSPIDRIIGRCAQICPANEAKSNYWQKHVLETGPPTRTQPQSTMNDGWRKVTLTVPNDKINDESNLGETPVAPPRRKRSSVIVDRQPCGFKELFGNNVSRRSSCDSILRDDNPLTEREQELLQHKRKSKSISDFNLNEIKPADGLSISTIRIPVTRTLSLMERSMVQQTSPPITRLTLQRKVSRVGNKKSDKFFGENLSDCLSDDPITPEPEPTSISFTYHTISTLITPIPHASVDGKDKLDDFIAANASAPTKSEAIEIPTPRPFIIGEQYESKQIADDDKKSSLDKKAEFLMAMLEGTSSYSSIEEPKSPPRRSHLKKRNSSTPAFADAVNNQECVVAKKSIAEDKSEVKERTVANNDDAEYYKGMTPVEEPLIVPRKSPTKHICDDDDHHIQKHIDHTHATPKENKPIETTELSAEEIEKYMIQQVNHSPEKPKRDLSVYEKSVRVTPTATVPTTPIITPVKPVETVNAVSKPVPRVRHLSQENLMSQKILAPPKSNDTIDLMRIKSMQNNTSSRSNNNNNNNINQFDFNKFNGDVRLESLLKKYTSQQSFFTQELLSQIADRVYGFSDPFEMHETFDDGSSKCIPNSKLTTRKISAHRKESTVTRPIFESEVEATSVETAPKNVQMEQKLVNPDINGNESMATDVENKSKETVNNAKNIENRPTFVDEQVKRDTESFISIERNNSEVCVQSKQVANVTSTQEIVQEQMIPSPESEIVPSSEEKKVKSLKGNTVTEQHRNCDSKSENLNSSDDENTDSDITVKEVPCVKLTEPKDEHQTLTLPNFGAAGKRGSIVEVDECFLKHNEFSNLQRRGSESNTGYDTRKVYPFGKSEPGAGSEFFDSKSLSKSAENILNDNVTKAELTVEQKENSHENSSTNDHSILLKYLK
ncbi:uncharacterized protein LOC129579449 isoform X2 [Sitodiplosis mosellana]|uniref:uncharacterized protein LOC129579449 isoform X2 n=1 Tax=Sitodiplosis mosellana TaxID=263140 RepID=UPI002443C7DD|nr:uncharacterized protein LOC129579449 isoform X2 [Sitodiplosis mosellana]